MHTKIAEQNFIKEVNDSIYGGAIKDYLRFFVNGAGDMLSYAYQGADKPYENLVQNNPDYYLFEDEVNVIIHNKEKFQKYLNDITDVIEIGPGSQYVIQKKTLPLLSYVSNLKNYHALDISEKYLTNACNFVKKNTKNLGVLGVNADLMSCDEISFNITPGGKKSILFLGGTIGNLTDEMQDNFFQKITKMFDSGDILILTADTNTDEQSLIKSYSNVYAREFLNNILKYFTYVYPSFNQYIELFEPKCDFDKLFNTVNLYFVAKNGMSFELAGNNITIFKGQKLKIGHAQKFDLQTMINKLYKNGLNTLDVLSLSNKMQIFVCTLV